MKQALSGQVCEHGRFLLVEQPGQIDYLEELIGRLNGKIAERLRLFETAIERLDAIPGINCSIAEVLLTEIGPDMNPFPDGHHLTSWAGMCPGHKERTGKRHSGRTRKANQ